MAEQEVESTNFPSARRRKSKHHEFRAEIDKQASDATSAARHAIIKQYTEHSLIIIEHGHNGRLPPQSCASPHSHVINFKLVRVRSDYGSPKRKKESVQNGIQKQDLSGTRGISRT